MAAGEFFTERDVASASKVCVIGRTLHVKLFPGQDPIGQQVRVKNIPFIVVGVLDEKGADLIGNDQDDIILMPYTTVRKRVQGSQFSNVDVIMLSARSEAQSSQAVKEVETLLAERHKIAPGGKNDFEVNNTVEIARVMNIITVGLTAMLSAIAAISLLVGGIGIMNIMLVSVTERTGNRPTHGPRAAARHPASISDRVDCALGPGRVDWHRYRRCWNLARNVDHQHRAADCKVAARDLHSRSAGRPRLRGRSRHVLRALPGTASKPAGSD